MRRVCATPDDMTLARLLAGRREGSSLQVWLLRSKESQREVSAAPSRASEAGSRMRKAASHMPLGSPPGER